MNETNVKGPSTRPGEVFVVCGGAGVGKSTFARRLAHAVGAAIIDIDPCTELLVQRGLVGHGLPVTDRDSPKYKSLYRVVIHKQLFSIAREQLLHSRIPVVLVAPFTTERRWPAATFATWLRDEIIGTSMKLKVTVVFLVCDPRERIRRIKQRNNPRDAQKFDDEAMYLQTSEDDPKTTSILLQAGLAQRSGAMSTEVHRLSGSNVLNSEARVIVVDVNKEVPTEKLLLEAQLVSRNSSKL